jgi:hypothetical protein
MSVYSLFWPGTATCTSVWLDPRRSAAPTNGNTYPCPRQCHTFWSTSTRLSAGGGGRAGASGASARRAERGRTYARLSRRERELTSSARTNAPAATFAVTRPVRCQRGLRTYSVSDAGAGSGFGSGEAVLEAGPVTGAGVGVFSSLAMGAGSAGSVQWLKISSAPTALTRSYEQSEYDDEEADSRHEYLRYDERKGESAGQRRRVLV